MQLTVLTPCGAADVDPLVTPPCFICEAPAPEPEPEPEDEEGGGA